MSEQKLSKAHNPDWWRSIYPWTSKRTDKLNDIIDIVFNLWGRNTVKDIFLKIKQLNNEHHLWEDYEILTIINAFCFFPRFSGQVKRDFIQSYLSSGPTSGNISGSQYMLGRLMNTTIINSTIGQSRLCGYGILDDSTIAEMMLPLPNGFKQLLCYYISVRQQWQDMKSLCGLWNDCDYFAEIRDGPISTEIEHGRYVEFYDMVMETFTRVKDSGVDVLENYVASPSFDWPGKRFGRDKPYAGNSPKWVYDRHSAGKISDRIQSRLVNHLDTFKKGLDYEGVLIYYPGSSNIFLEIYKSVKKLDSGKYHLIWNNDSNLYDAIDELDTLYVKALEDKNYIPKFYWAFVIVSPLSRGSAFVADLFR